MWKIILQILVYLLAVYGALALSFIVFNSISQRTKPERFKLKLVLLVKDREDSIEWVVRNVFSGSTLRKTMSENKFTVLDMGSTDETWKILNKLKGDYEQMELLNIGEKEKIFEGFDI